MFKNIRKLLILVALLIVAGVAYYFLSNPNYRRELSQRAVEVKEDLGDARKPAWSGTAVVVDIQKGDRIVMNTEVNGRVVARLAGIDAPELPSAFSRKGQPLAEESRQHLSDLVKDKAVVVQIIGTDEIKRPLILLTLDGTLINAKMAEAGMAEAAKETADAIPAKQKHAIENAELVAKNARLGIWGLTNYVRPIEYRIRVHSPNAAQVAR